jgi:GT2 family glycosyltransferase
MKVVAVILNWKRADLTLKCLRSVRHHAPDVVPLVVDNASDDGSVEQIRDEAPGVEILRNDTNRGYAGGNLAGGNRAFEMGAQAALILNNDVELGHACTDALIGAALADPQRGIVAPVSLKPGDHRVIDMHTASVDLHRMDVTAHGRGTGRMPTEDQESDYAPGSSFMITKEAWKRTGGFDERFFLVWEDVDLCLRVAKAGLKRPLIVANAHVFHEGSSTFGGAETPLYRYFLARNSYLLASKHLGTLRRSLVKHTLRKRYAGWAKSATDQQIAAALLLGSKHGRQGRFGPTPEEFL